MNTEGTEPGPAFRAAVIGLGFVGAGDQVSGDAIGQRVADLDGSHAHALADHARVTLVAGSSRDAGRRQRFTAALGRANTYADWREMLAREKPDIVSVATNSPHHADITVGCAEAGVRAVLCEKPIATRLSDAYRAVQACRERGTLLVVNHNRRWHPLWRQLRDEVQAGAIGDVCHATAYWSTGRLGNVGTHVLDALRMVLNAQAEGVSGVLDPELQPDCRGPQYRDPGAWGVVSFERGIKAFIHAPQRGSQPLGMHAVGRLGQLTIQGASAEIRSWAGESRTITAPADRLSSLHLAVQDVVTCLSQGGRSASPGEDGLAALEIIIGFHASHSLGGQWVSLPITGPARDLAVSIG